jgi:NADH-quinone oxidoreductase subunit E/NADH dehydrogenase (ubiquinone) flavoprotein 2
MGSCGTAPMIAVNEDYYEHITAEKAVSILNSLE